MNNVWQKTAVLAATLVALSGCGSTGTQNSEQATNHQALSQASLKTPYGFNKQLEQAMADKNADLLKGLINPALALTKTKVQLSPAVMMSFGLPKGTEKLRDNILTTLVATARQGTLEYLYTDVDEQGWVSHYLVQNDGDFINLELFIDAKELKIYDLREVPYSHSLMTNVFILANLFEKEQAESVAQVKKLTRSINALAMGEGTEAAVSGQLQGLATKYGQQSGAR